MANSFKLLSSNDFTTVKTLLHESVPLTGTLISSSSPTGTVKNYSHRMFQTVYDYPYLSSSANPIMDISIGYANSSTASGSASVENAKKINMYNQMAQVLMGFDITGSVQLFDEDGNLNAGGTKLKEVIFLNFNRLMYKDEIKKGTFNLSVVSGGAWASPVSALANYNDAHATGSYFVNSSAGEYSYISSSDGTGISGKAGLIFYQAGVVVLTASMFSAATQFFSGTLGEDRTYTLQAALTGTSATASMDAFRHRCSNISFVNTTELNSTVYFCRLNHNEFNYSSNPTYLSGSKIRVKQNAEDPPVAYITGVGLYSPDGELLAVGKLSEPVKKTPATETTLKVRIDY